MEAVTVCDVIISCKICNDAVAIYGLASKPFFINDEPELLINEIYK